MSMRESLYRLRRVAEQHDGHADVWVPDVRNILAALKASRAEAKELKAACEFFNFPDHPEGHLSEGELACTRALTPKRARAVRGGRK